MSAEDGVEARTLEELAAALEGVGFAGDWHANTAWAVRAVEYAAAQGIATLIHTGDFAFTFEREFLDGLQEACERWSVTVLAVRGNHDSTEEIGYLPKTAEGFLEARPRVLMIPDGHRWEINGVSLLGLGGAGSIDRALKPGKGPHSTRIVCLDRDDMGLESNVLTAAQVVGLPLTAPAA